MKSKSKAIVLLFLVGVLFFANVSLAGLVTCGGQDAYGNNQPPCDLKILVTTIARVINFLLVWAWLIAVLFIMWSGWNMINAAGNQEAITSAKAGLSNAVIGFFLIMASFVLINVIISIVSGNGIPRAGALINAIKLLP